MSSLKFSSVLGKVLLGCAKISVAVCTYKFYSLNKNKKVQTSSGEDVTPNEPAKVKLNGLFIFYVDNEFYHMSVRYEDIEYIADKVFMDKKDGLRLTL